MIALMLMLWLGLLVGPLDAAQPVGKVPRIGELAFARADSQRAQSLREVFLQGLREVGWVEGQNLVIESRWAEEQVERLPDLAADLVRLGVDVLVTSGGSQRSAR
jgi:putative ABC transport system substrate-binding protein